MTAEAHAAGVFARARHRDLRRARWLAALACALAALSLVSVGIGAVAITPAQAASILADTVGLQLPWAYDDTQAAVLLSIRLPRVVLAALIGAGLALSGAVLQGVFRNPLADPGLIGVSSGAALAVSIAIGVGGLGGLGLPLAAFAGGAAATGIVWRLSASRGTTSMTTMLLAGIAVNAIAFAGIGALTYVADDSQLRSMTFWQLGSLNGATWSTVSYAAPAIALALAACPMLARALDAMLLGDREAAHLGVHIERTKRIVVALASLAVGASVAAAGMIGFVGLVMPHLARLALGPRHRALVPAAALFGAIGLMAADALARTAVAPAELPIGVVTALLGAPFFLFLLVRANRRGGGLV